MYHLGKQDENNLIWLKMQDNAILIFNWRDDQWQNEWEMV